MDQGQFSDPDFFSVIHQRENVQIVDKVSISMVYGVERHFLQYFCYIVVVCFIGRGNRSTKRKPLTCHKSLTNFILYKNFVNVCLNV